MPDYVRAYFTLYERFEQEQENHVHRGHPFDYEMKSLIFFFTLFFTAPSFVARLRGIAAGHLTDQL